jgi:cytoskeleton protein RodZ
MRGVTLEEVSAATRISTRFLEALENEQWDRLPGGAFNRGFIRAIAKFLGLDEDSLVAEYAIETKSVTPVNVAPAASQGMPRDYRPAIAAAVALAVLIVALILGIHFYRAHMRAKAGEQSMAIPVLPKLPAPTPPYDLLLPATAAIPAADVPATRPATKRRHSH